MSFYGINKVESFAMYKTFLSVVSSNVQLSYACKHFLITKIQRELLDIINVLDTMI